MLTDLLNLIVFIISNLFDQFFRIRCIFFSDSFNLFIFFCPDFLYSLCPCLCILLSDVLNLLCFFISKRFMYIYLHDLLKHVKRYRLSRLRQFKIAKRTDQLWSKVIYNICDMHQLVSRIIDFRRE